MSNSPLMGLARGGVVNKHNFILFSGSKKGFESGDDNGMGKT